MHTHWHNDPVPRKSGILPAGYLANRSRGGWSDTHSFSGFCEQAVILGAYLDFDISVTIRPGGPYSHVKSPPQKRDLDCYCYIKHNCATSNKKMMTRNVFTEFMLYTCH